MCLNRVERMGLVDDRMWDDEGKREERERRKKRKWGKQRLRDSLAWSIQEANPLLLVVVLEL